MRILAVLTLIALNSLISSAAEKTTHNQLAPAQIREGWISLFDGQTLFGWQATSDVDWQVADGEIRATKGEMGLLATTTQFADYELHVEYKAGVESNSGVFLHTSLSPTDPATDCYELNIAPKTHTYPTGSFVGRQKISSVDPAAGEWHSFDVTADGNRIRVFLDGKFVVEYVDSNPLLRGRIGACN